MTYDVQALERRVSELMAGGSLFGEATLEARREQIRTSLPRCPHCDGEMYDFGRGDECAWCDGKSVLDGRDR